MQRDVGAFLTGLIIIAVVFTLVRPGSQGPSFVGAIGQAISNMLQAAGTGSSFTSATASTGTVLTTPQSSTGTTRTA
jgi:hypothetical protein